MALQKPPYYFDLIMENSMRRVLSRTPKGDSSPYCEWAPLEDADTKLIALRRTWEQISPKELTAILLSALRDKTMLARVLKLIDAEFVAIPGVDTSFVTGTAAKLLEKTDLMAEGWLDKLYHKISWPKTSDTFSCYVHTFVNGWVELFKLPATKLYLKYSDPLPYFLEQLQDATIHSVIPPTILDTLAAEKIAEERQKQGQRGEIEEEFSCHHLHKDPESREPRFRERASNESGYTLQDGPWLYRLPEPGRDGSYGHGQPLAFKHQYDAMKNELRRRAKEVEKAQRIRMDNQIRIIEMDLKIGATNKAKLIQDIKLNFESKERQKERHQHVVLVHSMDRDASEKHNQQLELDAQEETEFQARWKKSLAENADNPFVIEHGLTDAGERWTDMMARVYDSQKEVWDSKGMEAALAADWLLRMAEEEEGGLPGYDGRKGEERTVVGSVSMQRTSSGVGGSSTSRGDEPRSDAPSQGETPTDK